MQQQVDKYNDDIQTHFLCATDLMNSLTTPFVKPELNGMLKQTSSDTTKATVFALFVNL